MLCPSCKFILSPNQTKCPKCGQIISNNVNLLGRVQTNSQSMQASQNSQNIPQPYNQQNINNSYSQQIENNQNNSIIRKNQKLEQKSADYDSYSDYEKETLVTKSETIVRKLDTKSSKIIVTDKYLYVDGKFLYKSFDNRLYRLYCQDTVPLSMIEYTGVESVSILQEFLDEFTQILYFLMSFVISSFFIFALFFKGLGKIVAKAIKESGIESDLEDWIYNIYDMDLVTIGFIFVLVLFAIIITRIIYKHTVARYYFISYLDKKLYYKAKSDLLNKDIMKYRELEVTGD